VRADQPRLGQFKTCPKCRSASMQLARLAAHAILPKTDVLTFKCECGETVTHYVTHIQHS
jgi:hypothetical protein